MTMLHTLLQPVEQHLEALRDYLENQVAEFEPEIRNHITYCLKHSGKRIRPMLLFYSGWTGSRQPDSAMVKASSVVEMVHLATLVHDDILDGAALRHKSPTLCKLVGSDIAVLVGDALFAHALKLAAEFPTPEVCRIVAVATRRVCAGEIAQNFQRGNTELSRSLYYRIIDFKTAELFRVSCLLGAMLAGYPREFQAAAEGFGRHLGMAYQVFDDITDILGKEENAGKTLGTDAANCKLTLPLMLLADSMAAEQRSSFVSSLKNGGISREALREMLQQEALLERVLLAFREEIHQGESFLAGFSNLPPTSHLLSISRFVTQMVNHLMD